MGRVALVTGGSRGIGAAISKALKDAGYSVAANYAGNDEAAKAFTAETGIKTYKWSVADYDACAAGIEAVEADLGPVEVLVNNAGITRDAPFHKMTPQQWREVIDTNLSGVFNMTHPVWPFWPLIEEMVTIRPNLRSRMPGQTGWVMLKTPLRLVSMTSLHCCGVILWNIASRVMPALLTSTSIGPRSASTPAIPSAQAS